MKNFAELFRTIEESSKNKDKLAALTHYFDQASDDDKLWTIALFTGKRPSKVVTTSLLKDWVISETSIPTWLFEESHRIVGDLAETISLLLPEKAKGEEKSLTDWISLISQLRKADEESKQKSIVEAWSNLDKHERFVFNKLITGGFRVKITQKLMSQALAKQLNKAENEIAHRLLVDWAPETSTFFDLLVQDEDDADRSKPYPFSLAGTIEGDVSDLGKPEDWVAERKWKGIRAQVIHRANEAFIWSREEELVTDRFPELVEMILQLPEGTVIDGQILGLKDDLPLKHQYLQKRIKAKKPSKKLLLDCPVVLIAYDLLEFEGQDVRNNDFVSRKRQLDKMVIAANSDQLLLSSEVEFQEWDWLNEERKKARNLTSGGFMLKKRKSPYLEDRMLGDWWKWKLDPLTIHAVMIYAQRGQGARARVYTDFTFAVWDNDRLLTFTKANTGLTDEELTEIGIYVRGNTVERFGPVRSINPTLVFKLAFEGIDESKRHKSGVILRKPRIEKWCRDKTAKEADSIADLQKLIL